MPKIRQKYDFYSNQAFQKEIFIALARNGITNGSIRKLAETIGVAQSSLNTNLRHKPENLTIATLRKIVKAIKPDIHTALMFIGYESKDVQKFLKDNMTGKAVQ